LRLKKCCVKVGPDIGEALPAHKVIGNTPAASIPLNVTTI
jgi:hypothetical protein